MRIIGLILLFIISGCVSETHTKDILAEVITVNGSVTNGRPIREFLSSFTSDVSLGLKMDICDNEPLLQEVAIEHLQAVYYSDFSKFLVTVKVTADSGICGCNALSIHLYSIELFNENIKGSEAEKLVKCMKTEEKGVIENETRDSEESGTVRGDVRPYPLRSPEDS